LEERRNGTASGDVRRQYFWSIDYVDALTARVDYASGAVSATRHALYDANWNVTAIADASTGVLERYVFDPYGVVTVLYANWTVRGGSPYGWNYLHQGGRLDVDSNLYHFRHRDYSPTLGRWTQTDPIGFDAEDLNLYRYVGNGPLNGVDSWGLREIPEVGMGSGRGGPKNPGRPGNPNGRPVSTDNEWMDEFIFYDYWYYLTHPLEGSTGMVVAKGGLAVTALGTGSLACGLALSGSAATGAITKTTFIGTGGTHFIVKIGEKAYEGLGQKGAIRIFPLSPYEFPRTTYWNTITFPLRYPQRGIEYAEKAGVTTYNCLSAAVKIVWKAF
jgi:RHS repeat-associated protein